MSFGLKTLLLLAAVILFVVAAIDDSGGDWIAWGLGVADRLDPIATLGEGPAQSSRLLGIGSDVFPGPRFESPRPADFDADVQLDH